MDAGSAPLLTSLLRSVRGWTGLLWGGATGATYVLAGVGGEIAFGRPSSTVGLGLVLGIPLLGGVLALVGAVVGFAVGLVVRRTRMSGPVDPRVVLTVLALGMAGATWTGLRDVFRHEARNSPRVILSDEKVERVPGVSSLTRAAETRHLYGTARRPSTAPPPAGDDSLVWRGGRVGASLMADALRVTVDGRLVDRVSLETFDYARSVEGLTARLEPDKDPWLVLLVHLRATGMRELLLLYDPQGELVHQELLARTRSGYGTRLWAAGEREGPQEIVVDVGRPVRYRVPYSPRP